MPPLFPPNPPKTFSPPLFLPHNLHLATYYVRIRVSNPVIRISDRARKRGYNGGSARPSYPNRRTLLSSQYRLYCSTTAAHFRARVCAIIAAWVCIYGRRRGLVTWLPIAHARMRKRVLECGERSRKCTSRRERENLSRAKQDGTKHDNPYMRAATSSARPLCVVYVYIDILLYV